MYNQIRKLKRKGNIEIFKKVFSVCSPLLLTITEGTVQIRFYNPNR